MPNVPGFGVLRRLRMRLRFSEDRPGPGQRDRDIYRKTSSLDEFWELAHARDDSWWTSGTPFEYIRRVFDLPDDLAMLRVLVVGVGQGNELRGFREAGAVVSGLDISQAAHDRFMPLFPMFREETLTGTFDLMVMHLVAQHLSNEQLSRLFRHLSACLAADGALHVQFACSIHTDPESATKAVEDLGTLMGGSRTREILEIVGIASRDFGIGDLRVIGVFPEFAAYHLAVTLLRRDNPTSFRFTT